jgi:outer membrane protein assembly factor BamB
MRAQLSPLVVVALGVIAQPVAAVDWAQWRGPQRTGVSAEKGLADQWPQAGPVLVWQVGAIGNGYGSPSVVGDRIYLLSNEGLENEFVQALDAKDGRQIWSQRIGNVGNPDQQPPYPAARSTPTVDGQLLYAFSSDGDLACLETATGRVRWQKNVRREFGGKPGTWAYAESPLVDGDVVVCAPGGPDATIVALNKLTGDVVWKCPVPVSGAEPEDAGYASTIVVDAGGKKQYVQFLSKGVVGVEAASGTFLWRYDRTGGSPANIATPVAQGEYVYTPNRRDGSGLVKLAASQGGVTAEQIYLKRELPNAIGGSVIVGNYLYGTTQQGLICVEFVTGEEKWRNASIGVSSICAADGMLFLHGENGEVALVEASPVEYRERGRFAPPNPPTLASQGEKAWAYPAVANGRLYIRNKNVLWCYDVAGSTTTN